jgi:hypothetical protein
LPNEELIIGDLLFSAKCVISRELWQRGALCSSGGTPSPLESITYALLHLPRRNNRQDWQVLASAMLFRVCSLQFIAQQSARDDSAGIAFFPQEKKMLVVELCYATLRMSKLTLATKDMNIYMFQREINVYVSKRTVDTENSN